MNSFHNELNNRYGIWRYTSTFKETLHNLFNSPGEVTLVGKTEQSHEFFTYRNASMEQSEYRFLRVYSS